MSLYLKHILACAVACLFFQPRVHAQCATASGDEVTYGTGSWIGYVYEGVNSFTTATYMGTITEPAAFDESFCGNNCNFTAATGCAVNTETFSIRFKMRETFACGTYLFTVGADDGVRLSIDGGSTYLINAFTDHPYQTYTGTAFLAGGTYDLVIEYYENAANNRVSFSSSLVVPGHGGQIGTSQTICAAPIDPAAFTNNASAFFCSGATPNYQWQESPDGTTWSDIGGATADTYDVPAGLSIGTHYYQRTANDGLGNNVTSNVISVAGDSPQGDPNTYGAGSWIGYVYDGVANFTTNYYGYFTEAATFDETFCGNACTFALNGCDINTETFTARLKMQLNLCGNYQFTIGGDDGVRLSIDGGSTYLINQFTDHGYTTYSASTFVNGTLNLVLDYYENGGGNRVSFTYTLIEPGHGGGVAGNQTLCQASIDPAAFTSTTAAFFCSGLTPSYQWQSSPDNTTWSNIASATAATYDPPAGQPAGTTYFRRVATDGITTVNSNVITVVGDAQLGDQTTYGVNSWIGYTYDGVNTYAAANYHGYFTEAAIFDESFCGANCTFALNGCDINTETFTVRFKMRITLANAGYTFVIGADDGVRLSINGGSTYLLNDYSDHGYRTVTSGVVNMNGTYDLILEFYENGGGNRVSFSYTAGPLPVEFAYLHGYYSEGYTTVEWRTASEKDNRGFDVERSRDGEQFDVIGWVDGHGTTLAEQAYSFADSLPALGWNYYRLKQVDWDGAAAYSSLIPVYVDELPALRVYPNPVGDGHVFVSGIDPALPVTFTLTHMVTCQVRALKQDPEQPAHFFTGDLDAGMYAATITSGDRVLVKKVVVK